MNVDFEAGRRHERVEIARELQQLGKRGSPFNLPGIIRALELIAARANADVEALELTSVRGGEVVRA